MRRLNSNRRTADLALRGLVLGIAGLLASASLAQSDAVIYRCEEGGVIEFSDRPCADDARPSEPLDLKQGSVSVISPPDDLEALQETSQAWMRDYRDRQQAERLALERARLARDARPAPRPEPLARRTAIAPLFWNLRPQHDRYPSQPDLESAPPMSRHRPYSAFSGPFPGTRRSGTDSRQILEKDQ